MAAAGASSGKGTEGRGGRVDGAGETAGEGGALLVPLEAVNILRLGLAEGSGEYA